MLTNSKNVANVLPIATRLLVLAGFVVGTSNLAVANDLACTVTGTSLGDARQQFEQSCPQRTRRDCDPLGDGWQCSTENLPLTTVQGTPTVVPENSNPSTPISDDVVLSRQAENASQTSGSGWSTESALSGFTGSGYIVWRGQDDFRTSDDAPPAGIKAYDFTVTQAGTYQFTARVQARVGNGSAAADKDNDAWVRFTSGEATAGVQGDAAKWTKFFVSGADESWKNYSSGEQYDPTFFTSIQRDLPAGTHRILIGGRSARFAIDNVGLRLLRATSVSQPVVSTPTTEQPIVPVAPNSCTAQGSSLPQAAANYASNCPTVARKDCDPIGNGNWMCSSENIESGTTPVTPVVTPTETSNCTAIGSSLPQAVANYANACPTIARQDCDPVGDGRWLCSSNNISNASQLVADTPTSPTDPLTTGRMSTDDLLVLHYDNCPDRDDGHAIVAGKAVVNSVGIQNTIVVNGTCGASIRNRYQPSSVNVLNATWGSDWLDGFNQEASAVIVSADRWAATLSSGNDVWVAEGGPSDFTAKVLQRIGNVYPSVDRKRIHVIQHSSGQNFNEFFTSAAAIALVKEEADYRAIPNGNLADNGSADFNQQSTYFLDIALQSRYASEWSAAFTYLNPADKLDFSDTVELLYIIDDAQTLSVDAFANRYLR